MKEHAIVADDAMVRAVRAGRKTQARQPMKLPAESTLRGGWEATTIGGEGCFDAQRRPVAEKVAIWNQTTGKTFACPYDPGDRLWVREAWRVFGGREYEYQCDPGAVIYRADPSTSYPGDYDWNNASRMPRWASRLTLEVTRVRVELAEAITEADARAEGVVEGLIPADDYGPVRVGYVMGDDDGRCLLHPTPAQAVIAAMAARYSAEATRGWVWVIEFKRMDGVA